MGNNQTIQCGKYIGEERTGETRPLRNINLPDGADGLIKDFKGVANLKDLFQANVKAYPHRPMLGSRTRKLNEKGEVEFGMYEWKTFSQVSSTVDCLVSFLYDRKLCPKVKFEEGEFRFISIYAKNREEWILTDLACMNAAITSVTLYDTLGKDSIEYILDQTMIKTVVCEADKVKNIIALKKERKISNVTHVIYFDDVKKVEIDEIEASTLGLSLIKFSVAIEEGRKIKDVSPDPVTPDTFYTFSYTSGTTGMPKGVMLTHRNFVCNIGGINVFDG